MVLYCTPLSRGIFFLYFSFKFDFLETFIKDSQILASHTYQSKPANWLFQFLYFQGKVRVTLWNRRWINLHGIKLRTCKKCRKGTCLRCKQHWHEGVQCTASWETKLNFFVTKRDERPCPKCGAYGIKREKIWSELLH